MQNIGVLLTHLATACAILASMSFSTAAIANTFDSCPSAPFTETQWQLVSAGKASTADDAVALALRHLNMRINGAAVEEQFIQRHQNNSTQVESYAQVKALNKVQLRVSQQVLLKCKVGFVSYLLYDTRSLAVRLSAAFGGQAYRLLGQGYLLNSPLLKPYNNKSAPAHKVVSLSVTNADSFSLTIGTKQLILSATDMHQLVPLAAKTTGKLRLTLQQPRSDFILPSYQISLIAEPVDTLKNTRQIAKQYDLYICDQRAQCDLVAMNMLSGDSLSLLHTNSHTTDDTYTAIAIRSVDSEFMRLQNTPSSLAFYLLLRAAMQSKNANSAWVQIP